MSCFNGLYFFDENSTVLRDQSRTGGAVKIGNMSNQELAVELHKLIIRKFKKRKVYSYFIGNNWGANDTDMQLMTKFNKGSTKLKILCHRHMSIVILTVRTFLDCFSKKSCRKHQKEFRIEKVIKGKDNNLYVECKGLDSSFNSWIDKKYII